MDIEVQPQKLIDVEYFRAPACKPHSTVRPRRIYTGVVLFAILVGLGFLTGETTLDGLITPKPLVLAPRRHHLSTKAKEALFV